MPVDFWSERTLKPLLVPGGFLLAAAVLLLQTGIVATPASAIESFYYLVFAAGMLLALRFHSSRVLFALVVLLLAHRALEFFSAGGVSSAASGRTAFRAVAFLLPLNFIVLSHVRERGFAVSALASRLGILFVESVFVAVVCRPGQGTSLSFLDYELVSRGSLHSATVPQLAWLACAATVVFLLVRFLLYRKPLESGLLWALLAAFFGLQAGGAGRAGSAYFATGALILASCIIENSYLLAYHDELTSLPGRRAFNEALLNLEPPYTVAMVDIDHFKNLNDTYGHDTGDHVLRMVSAKLAGVGADGEAFRVGGEEFCILFPRTTMQDALPHLEWLRAEIEHGFFRMRGANERRQSAAKTTDRRKTIRRPSPRTSRKKNPSGEIPVTVSIGAAEPGARLREVEKVIRAADQALYVAKQNGRNRVESTAAAAASRPKRITA